MTIQTAVHKARFIGNGVNTTFPFSFKTFATTDLQLTQTSVAGVDVSVTSLFSIALNVDQEGSPGGVITYPTSGAPLAIGVALTVVSVLAETQLTDLTNAGGFFPKTITDRFDYLTILIQQHSEKLGRVALGSVSDVLPNFSIGTAVQRAGKYLTFDGSGNVALAQSLPNGTLSQANIGAFLYPQTLAEAAAGVTPVNFQYPPYTVDRYGTNTIPGTTNMTTAINNAALAAGVGSTVRFLGASYAFNGTLTKYAGQIWQGAGYSTIINTYTPSVGSTVLLQTNLTGIPAIQSSFSAGVSPTNGGLRDLALQLSGGGGSIAGQVGFQAVNSPWESLDNVYVTGFHIGIEQGQNCWGWTVRKVTVLDADNALYNHDAGEDSTYISCSFRSYRAAGIGVNTANQAQTNYYLGCDISDNGLWGCLLSQGDTNGNGTGVPYPMHATFINCQFEDNLEAAIGMVTSNENYSNTAHPGVTAIGCRAFISGTFLTTIAATTAASGTGATATITFPVQATAPTVGSTVNVAGVTPLAYNGSFVVTASTTSSVSYASAATGAQTVAGTVTYGAGAKNNQQSFIYAAHASQIRVENMFSSGYSFGATLGVAKYGYAPVGSAVGQTVWSLDNAATWGSARINGAIANVSLSPGDRPLTRLTATALSYLSGNNTRIPFVTVVSDAPGWASNANQGWIPTRAQTVRFRAQIATTSAPVGVYTLSLYKNSAQVAVLTQMVVSSASQPLCLAGEFYDVPNGTTDFYWINVNANVNFTLDTTVGNTWAIAEIAGT